jgi:hypothetical protein
MSNIIICIMKLELLSVSHTFHALEVSFVKSISGTINNDEDIIVLHHHHYHHHRHHGFKITVLALLWLVDCAHWRTDIQDRYLY